MKSIIDNLVRELPADVETVAFPKEAYLELLKEIDDMRNNAKSFTSVLEDADAALKAADYRLDQQATRIAQLTQWLESAENACREKDEEIARLKESNNSLLDARRALTELNQAYERVRTTTQQLVKQKTELEKQLNELKSADNRQTQAEVAQLTQEKARLTVRLENADKQIEGLQNTIETLRFRNHRLDTMASERHTSLAAELNRLRDELIKTRQDRDYWISLVRGVHNTTAVVADRK